MRIILGIGNPGREYEKTRHNCGFFVVDHLARSQGLTWNTNKRWKTDICQWRRSDDDTVLLLRPTTYVNGSGETAQAVCAYYKIKPENLLVVVDDIHLKFGDLRLRVGGSSGGHNGLKDIEQKLGKNYPRLRMGIGAPKGDQVSHVLGGFHPDEQSDLDKFITKSCQACEAWLTGGPDRAMRFNGPLNPPPPKPKKPKQTTESESKPEEERKLDSKEPSSQE